MNADVLTERLDFSCGRNVHAMLNQVRFAPRCTDRPTMPQDEAIRREIDRLADVLRESRLHEPDDLTGREQLWIKREKLRAGLPVATATVP